MAKPLMLALAALAVALVSVRPVSAAQSGSEFFESVIGVSDGRKQPGGVGVLVENGEVSLVEGFGTYAIGNPTPLSGDSVFAVASVSKVVTAYTVLTFVQDGELSLDTSVAELLPDLGIPEGVQVRHLLSHTSGLEERFVGTASRDISSGPALREMLASELPPFSYEPGEVYRYSNWNAALLGLIVEELSGKSFAASVRERVFEPLGMSSSFYSREQHAGQNERVPGNKYDWDKGWEEFSPFYVLLEPAGGLMTTPDDMARFMTHLLSEEVAASDALSALYAPSWQPSADSAQAVGSGTMLRRHEGLRLASHTGAFQGVASCLVLVPEKRTGYFVVCNFENTSLGDSWREFVYQWFGVNQYAAAAKHDTPLPHGVYRDLRFQRSTRTAERLSALLGVGSELRITAANELSAAVSPLVVDSHPGDTFVVSGLDTFVRLRWYERSELRIAVLAVVLFAQLLMLLLILLKRPWKRAAEAKVRARCKFYWVINSAGLFVGLAAVGFVVAGLATVSPMELMYGYTGTMQVGIALAWVQSLLALLALGATPFTLMRRTAAKRARALRVCALLTLLSLSTVFFWLGWSIV